MIIWTLITIFKLLMDTFLKYSAGPQTGHFAICFWYFLTFYMAIRLRFRLIGRPCRKLVKVFSFGRYFSVPFLLMSIAYNFSKNIRRDGILSQGHITEASFIWKLLKNSNNGRGKKSVGSSVRIFPALSFPSWEPLLTQHLHL